MQLAILLSLIGLVWAVVFGAMYLSFHWDVIVVLLMRRFNIRRYPVAIEIATLLMSRPQEWTYSDFWMSHPTIGSIYTSSNTTGLYVKTAMGVWRPNAIERRIIHDAVVWRTNDFLRQRLAVALRTHAPILQG